MSARVGLRMGTVGGGTFWPCDPRPEEIVLEDIAHALSQQCRFAGHTSAFYSVAEHCVRVSLACDPADALWGLMHDASEAYLCDVPRPLKTWAPLRGPYLDLEDRLMAAVCARFGLDIQMPWSVHVADNVLLATEARDLMGNPQDWHLPHPPLVERIRPWGPGGYARWKFLARFRELAGKVPEVPPVQDYDSAQALLEGRHI